MAKILSPQLKRIADLEERLRVVVYHLAESERKRAALETQLADKRENKANEGPDSSIVAGLRLAQRAEALELEVAALRTQLPRSQAGDFKKFEKASS